MLKYYLSKRKSHPNEYYVSKILKYQILTVLIKSKNKDLYTYSMALIIRLLSIIRSDILHFSDDQKQCCLISLLAKYIILKKCYFSSDRKCNLLAATTN